jgi:hypothetical protein
MFCPACAAPNQDQTKFCRHCGTDLKSVALALKGRLALPAEAGNAEGKKRELAQEWIRMQGEGIQRLVQGALLFGTSALIGVALALFSHKPDWMIIWIIFCSWIAVWGAVTMGTGLSKLIHSRMLLRRIDKLVTAMAALAAPLAGETQRMPEPGTTPEVSPPLSVSEHTTTQLNKPHPRF